MVEGHAIGRAGVGADDRHLERVDREPLDVHRAGPRDRREVQGVLLGDIQRSLVRVHVEYVSQARSIAEDDLELRIVDQARRGPTGEGTDGAGLPHTR